MPSLIQRLTHQPLHTNRPVLAGLAVLLLGTGLTAFSVPALLDAPAPPSAQIIEPVLAPMQLSQADQPSVAPFVLFRSDYTRSSDTATSLFSRLGLKDPEALAHLRNTPALRDMLRAGRLVTAEADDKLQLNKLTVRWVDDKKSDSYQKWVLTRNGKQFELAQSQDALTKSIRLSSGLIQSSLFEATDAANLPDSIASQLADLFSSEIDFRRDLRKGDRFSVVYETLEADGEVLRFGKLVGAEFVNNREVHQAVWFEAPGQRGGYFNMKGESTQRAFLAAPLTFSRVSSGYGMRFHPVSGNRKAHLGVDYAAPTGTPVRALADGVVKVAGRQSGYGNVVILEHRGGVRTVYGHLSKIGVRTGQRVSQSDLVGNVGCTGTCTGPHLHLEYIVNGVHKDPVTMAKASESVKLPAVAKAAFDATAREMASRLASAATIVQASAE